MTNLNDEDRKWLINLDEQIWNRHRDNFGSVHRFENCQLDTQDLERLTSLIMEHRLPCVLGSGPYGNLSMRIFGHSDFPEVPPDPLISIGEKHIGLPAGFDRWNERFDWFSQFTHSDSNREILDFYGLPKPERRERYEY